MFHPKSRAQNELLRKASMCLGDLKTLRAGEKEQNGKMEEDFDEEDDEEPLDS